MRNTLRLDAFAVVDRLERCETVSGVMDDLEYFVRPFGFVALLIAKLQENSFDTAILASRWPEDFQKIYLRENYIRFDPVVQLARNAALPLLWGQSTYAHEQDSRARNVIHCAAEFGLKQGLVVPIHNSCRYPAVVSMSGGSIEVTPHVLPAIRLVALYAFERIRRLTASACIRTANALTAREREVLRWIAGGKTAQETGEILDITSRTVNGHVKAVCSKLGAANRTQAVASAIRSGII